MHGTQRGFMIRGLSFAIAAALWCAPPVHAQDAAPPPASKPADQAKATPTTLGTVIVTASRRDESLQKVAMPVSVLTYHDIERQHLQDFADYAATVPGLNAVSAGPGLTEVSIRGIASGSSQPSASVGIYVDETPYGSSSVFAEGSLVTPDIDPADLERIEVLRGPQGTLYGAGALGGVIRFITIPPDTHDYAGRLQLDGTSVSGGGNGFGVHGMANLPLVTDKLAVRVNVYDRTDPGFIDDAGRGKTDVNESRVKGGRASLLWTPTATTSLRITAMAQNLSSDGSPSEALDPDTLQPVYGNLQQRVAAGTGSFDGRYRLYNATFKTDFGWSTLTASSSYSTLDSLNNLDATPLLYLGPQANGQPYATFEQDLTHQTKATQEIRLQSAASQTVEWLGGIFYTHETANHPQHIYPTDYFTGTPLPSPFGMSIGDDDQPSTYDAWAAYGSLTWHITDRFDVEAGLRYSHDKQHYTEIGSGLLFGTPAPTVLLDKHSSDSSTTFSLTPRYKINDTTMLYARAASGFLPGGPNIVTVAIPGVPKTFSPTKLTDYEVGLKATSADHRVMADLSAYYIDWTKIPLVTFINPFTFLGNGGQAKSKGLEATVAVIPAQGLKLSLNAAYNDATLTKDAPFPSNGKRGDPLPYAPQFTLSLNGDYDFALTAGWHGYVGASYHYIGERSTDFAFNYPIAGVLPALPSSPTIPGYGTIDLRAGVNRDQWSIDAWVKNATNQRGIVLASTFANYVPIAGQVNPVTGKMEDNATIITPRMFGISVSRSF
ncbi:MAG: TonB-dependent receptor [Rhodanobacteraceae bacterium]|jgi:outer membrane receptor protein involved in Fe transport|nr:MAG: TonB-dependent receptor [Rhodanobacteraceae bacterium]